MPALQIHDLDQVTMTLLRKWAADHGRTLEDEARTVLQRIVNEAANAPSGYETSKRQVDFDGCSAGNQDKPSRGAASLEPMTLSPEDAAIMREAWENGLARPKMPVVSLPQFEG